MAIKNIHALSTTKADPKLINEGLVQRGIIGYIEKNQNRTATLNNLSALRLNYKNGLDYLYTTDSAQETLTNLEWTLEGTLGYCYRSRLPNTLRLYRFFNKKSLSHLQVTKPNVALLLSQGYHEENKIPVYLNELPSEDRIEVFFYTNSDFIPTGISSTAKKTIKSENFKTEDAIREFQEIIVDNTLSEQLFRIINEDNSITVFLENTVFNFYVNLQENKEYFTVRINPSPQKSAYLINDVSTWVNVIFEFQVWLDSIRIKIPKSEETNPTSSKSPVTQIPSKKYYEASTDFEFRNNNIDPVLKVKDQADIFIRLLRSIKKSETGLLIGVFGQWGRGKTYFWNQVKSKLNEKTELEYQTVEFHAWKYQDTPASWAYLYEQCAEQYYKEPRKFLCINLSFLNRVRLNIKRHGKLNLILTPIWLIAAFIWSVLASFELKLNIFEIILSVIPISTVISLTFYYFKFSGKAKSLFKTYFSKASFNELLGIQAEVQNEISRLFQVWIPQNKVGKKRVILFVDDIDRCNEDRIIQVIDSLKIMIDDPAVSDRLIVVAAIDEEVLKRAIRSKYYESVEHDDSIENKLNTLDKLCREYMDKLFISGFKLAPLSALDNEELFLSLVKEKVLVSIETNTNDKNSGIPESFSTSESKSEPNQNGDQTSFTSEHQNEQIKISADPKFELTDAELKLLVSAVKKYQNSTPRGIRLFYYRYLLAKNFKDLFIKSGSELYNSWNEDQDRKSLLPFLIIQYSGIKNHSQLRTEIIQNEIETTETVTVSVLSNNFKISRTLYIELLRIVEIVVPY